MDPAHRPFDLPMQLRVARHTQRLEEVVAFYRDGIGLPETGRFRDHDGYDGVFLAIPGSGGAHLELTSGGAHGSPTPHPESLIVLYVGHAGAVRAIENRMRTVSVAPANPYWAEHGLTFEDPDGFRVVLVPERWDTRHPGTATSDIAFTTSVKAIQVRKGSRDAYARMERGGGWSQTIDAELRAFIAAQTSVFLATANAGGQPYIQHRGGPAGFMRLLDERTIAFADYRGNRQFITTGNLGENRQAFLFLIDYARRRRIKIWGTARVEDDAELVGTLMPAGYRARPEQAIVFTVEAWDENCPQHIPQRFEAADVARALAERDATIAERDGRIAALEAELRERESRV